MTTWFAWFYSNLIGGVKLQVSSEDAAAATEILDQPEQFVWKGAEHITSLNVPTAGFDVSFEELDKSVAFVSAYIGFPFLSVVITNT